MRRLLALPLLLALVACGNDATVTPRASDSPSSPPASSPPVPSPTQHSYAPDGVVLRVRYTGGLAPVDDAVDVPAWSLYGDGRVMTLGAVPAIYPGPAFPPVMVARISADQVAVITSAAREAGVDGEKRDYGDPNVADATSTEFHLSDHAGTVDLSVYALTYDFDGGLTAEQQANRKRLRVFLERFVQGEDWRGPEKARDEAYEPATVAVYARPWQARESDPGTPQQIAWRGPDPATGQKHVVGACTTVSGDTLATVLPDLRRSNTRTRWTYGGNAYSFVLRPLLPDEKGCV